MQIRNIVFDLGKVLFDFSFDPFVRFLQECGADFHDVNDFLIRCCAADYECGRISSEEFLSLISAHLSRPPAAEEPAQRWQNIFTPFAETISFQQQLRASYRVFILSNSNDLHWKALREIFHLDALAEASLSSFQVGAMKPSLEIFRAAEKRFGIAASETLLIDDLESNVKGARLAGWHAIHHSTLNETRRELEKLGISPG
jgi:HAD superfamily hydrolase (TIGR01509 family)